TDAKATDDQDRGDLATDEARPRLWTALRSSEDWLAVWLGGLLLAAVTASVFVAIGTNDTETRAVAETAKSSDDASGEAVSPKADSESAPEEKPKPVESPLKPWVGKPGKWSSNPLESLYPKEKKPAWGTYGAFLISLVLFAVGSQVMGRSAVKFALGFPVVFLLAIVAYVLAGQEVVSHYNLEYALWALVVGLLISNTIGTPAFVKPAVRTEFFIKTGLVLLGAEVLLSQLVALGLPGVFVAWVVTPIVLISTYVFGQRVLKIESNSLNMVISADMSVCGVSAAIATAAACKAKKEELSLAIGMSLSFTVVMMVVMPVLIRLFGIDDILGGAWMGGTIDSTGAVAAAGAALGEDALKVAATVKMIQNILIGVVAFGVAVYWVTCVEPNSGARPGASEIWYRFPKFVLGFVAASIVFSLLFSYHESGPDVTKAVTNVTKTFRGWFFCLAFVSIGLETRVRELMSRMEGGKPLVLYLCGQTLNVLLTLAMAYVMFNVLFRERVMQLFES
ncbi:MAG: putative sulfate exporter family transporter, partial [Planctomycetales bacterium]|nr:putative sulfate exporter family transporter [Planctomycetales bacterium]